MSTTTDTDVFVLCDRYCGKRIRKPKDHARDCGASELERAAILKQLSTLKIQAAARNGVTETEIEVDAKQARHRHSPPPEPAEPKPDYSRFWKDPESVGVDVIELQRRIDGGTILVGGVPASKACAGKQTREIDGTPTEIDCPHKIAFRTIRRNVCNLEHRHTETLEALCVIHTIVHLGGDQPVAGPGPLFGADA
jgi:hypothetical protein